MYSTILRHYPSQSQGRGEIEARTKVAPAKTSLARCLSYPLANGLASYLLIPAAGNLTDIFRYVT